MKVLFFKLAVFMLLAFRENDSPGQGFEPEYPALRADLLQFSPPIKFSGPE